MVVLYTYVHRKNKSRYHAYSSGKHTMQNAARCRDMLQHPFSYDSCTANASLCNIISMEHQLGIIRLVN